MISDYFKMFRPFTLVAVALGSFSAGLIAMHDTNNFSLQNFLILALVMFIMAVTNASGNVINELFDKDIDRISKPYRPYVSGKVSFENANTFAVMLFGLGIVLAFLINVYFGILVAIIQFFAWNYSAPPLRFKKRFVWGNLAIATPRGALGVFAAYVALSTHISWAIVILSSALAFYVFFGNTTKDFFDYEADKLNGIRNFVTVFGIKRSALLSIAGFYIPFVFFNLGVFLHLLPKDMLFMNILLPVSIYETYFLVKDPLHKTKTENSLAWTVFYLEMGAITLLYSVLYILENFI